MLGRDRDPEHTDELDEAVIDRLHLSLLDLFLPGHAESAADRARARERVALLVERVVELEGDRGGG